MPSPSRISDQAVEELAKRKWEEWVACEDRPVPWTHAAAAVKAEALEAAREDLIAIHPLLCGPVEEKLRGREAALEGARHRISEATAAREEAEQELEQVRAERDRAVALKDDAYRYQQAAEDLLNPEQNRVAALTQQLNQVREEVEEIIRVYNDDSLSNSAAQDQTEEVARRLQAILDSAPPLSGDEKSSDEEKAVDVLRRFMCCKAGEQFVDEKLLRPFGFTLDPGPVVRSNRNLIDALEWIEVETRETHTRDAARRAVEANQPSGEEENSSAGKRPEWFVIGKTAIEVDDHDRWHFIEGFYAKRQDAVDAALAKEPTK